MDGKLGLWGSFRMLGGTLWAQGRGAWSDESQPHWAGRAGTHQERAESKGGFVVRALVSLQQLKYGSMYVRVLVRRAKQMGEAE